jgi:hypothetical protein
MDDPSAVTPQVNKVAKRASNTGLYSSKKSNFIVIYFYDDSMDIPTKSKGK